MSQIKGTNDAKYEIVCQHLKENIESGVELGASIYVNVGSRCVLDIWGGYSDSSRTKLWTENTITCVWSISKTITVLAALILVDRGLLDVNAKVVKYWPEFGVNGKEDIEVRHILCHVSGLSAWETPIDIEGIYDTAKSTSLLATQSPWWSSRSTSGYHVLTQGNLLGELVRRVTKKPLKRFIAEEMTGLIQADYQLGLEESDWHRAAEIIPAALPIISGDNPRTVAYKTVQGTPIKAEYANGIAFRRTEMGATNGFGNARSIGRLLSMLACGGIVDGIRFITQKTIGLVFEEQTSGVDLVLQIPCRWGMGFALPSPDADRFKFLPHEGVCYWGGWGGSIVLVDRIRQMTICYVMNQLEEASATVSKTERYVQLIYEAYEKQT